MQCSVTQLCPTLCNPVDCSPPGSSVPEISQARIPEWIAISFSRGSSQPRSLVSPVLAGGFFISVPPGKSQIVLLPLLFFFFLSAKKRTCSYVFKWMFSSVQFSCSAVSDSLRPHESQHARPPCPSPTPGIHSDSCPSSQ